MKEEFKYIVLPPDGFHMTLRDRIVDARNYISDVLDVIDKVRQPGEKVIVKYRTENQRKAFPTTAQSQVGYGKLLDLCNPGTVVVGRPGSATWECLLNDISFYPFWDFLRYRNNLFTNKEAVVRLSELLHISRDKQELHLNISQGAIYQTGRSKSDLLHPDGVSLTDIVTTLLARENHKHA